MLSTTQLHNLLVSNKYTECLSIVFNHFKSEPCDHKSALKWINAISYHLHSSEFPSGIHYMSNDAVNTKESMDFSSAITNSINEAINIMTASSDSADRNKVDLNLYNVVVSRYLTSTSSWQNCKLLLKSLIKFFYKWKFSAESRFYQNLHDLVHDMMQDVNGNSQIENLFRDKKLLVMPGYELRQLMLFCYHAEFTLHRMSQSTTLTCDRDALNKRILDLIERFNSLAKNFKLKFNKNHDLVSNVKKQVVMVHERFIYCIFKMTSIYKKSNWSVSVFSSMLDTCLHNYNTFIMDCASILDYKVSPLLLNVFYRKLDTIDGKCDQFCDQFHEIVTRLLERENGNDRDYHRRIVLLKSTLFFLDVRQESLQLANFIKTNSDKVTYTTNLNELGNDKENSEMNNQFKIKKVSEAALESRNVESEAEVDSVLTIGDDNPYTNYNTVNFVKHDMEISAKFKSILTRFIKSFRDKDFNLKYLTGTFLDGGVFLIQCLQVAYQFLSLRFGIIFDNALLMDCLEIIVEISQHFQLEEISIWGLCELVFLTRDQFVTSAHPTKQQQIDKRLQDYAKIIIDLTKNVESLDLVSKIRLILLSSVYSSSSDDKVVGNNESRLRRCLSLLVEAKKESSTSSSMDVKELTSLDMRILMVDLNLCIVKEKLSFTSLFENSKNFVEGPLQLTSDAFKHMSSITSYVEKQFDTLVTTPSKLSTLFQCYHLFTKLMLTRLYLYDIIGLIKAHRFYCKLFVDTMCKGKGSFVSAPISILAQLNSCEVDLLCDDFKQCETKLYALKICLLQTILDSMLLNVNKFSGEKIKLNMKYVNNVLHEQPIYLILVAHYLTLKGCANLMSQEISTTAGRGSIASPITSSSSSHDNLSFFELSFTLLSEVIGSRRDNCFQFDFVDLVVHISSLHVEHLGRLCSRRSEDSKSASMKHCIRVLSHMNSLILNFTKSENHRYYRYHQYKNQVAALALRLSNLINNKEGDFVSVNIKKCRKGSAIDLVKELSLLKLDNQQNGTPTVQSSSSRLLQVPVQSCYMTSPSTLLSPSVGCSSSAEDMKTPDIRPRRLTRATALRKPTKRLIP